jgi:excisionase family DNA binding protein
VITPHNQTEHLMTSGEVAEYFNVHPHTVDRWDRAGRLKAALRTPGGHRRYRESDVIAAGKPDTGAHAGDDRPPT